MPAEPARATARGRTLAYGAALAIGSMVLVAPFASPCRTVSSTSRALRVRQPRAGRPACTAGGLHGRAAARCLAVARDRARRGLARWCLRRRLVRCASVAPRVAQARATDPPRAARSLTEPVPARFERRSIGCRGHQAAGRGGLRRADRAAAAQRLVAHAAVAGGLSPSRGVARGCARDAPAPVVARAVRARHRTARAARRGVPLFLSMLTKSTLCLATMVLLTATTRFSDCWRYCGGSGYGIAGHHAGPHAPLSLRAGEEMERMQRARRSRTFVAGRSSAWRNSAQVAGNCSCVPRSG